MPIHVNRISSRQKRSILVLTVESHRCKAYKEYLEVSATNNNEGEELISKMGNKLGPQGFTHAENDNQSSSARDAATVAVPFCL